MNTEDYLEEMVGKTFSDIIVKEFTVKFIEKDTGDFYTMYHRQDCCESVFVEDIVGDIEDLIGIPILKAYEATDNTSHPPGKPQKVSESFTWTFYHFATIKGYVTIRFFGESNGYYSEAVDISKNEDYD